MNLGVLLLSVKAPRVSTFTRDWAQRAVQRTVNYFGAQSAGREPIGFKVFDWVALDLTPDEWSALGFSAHTSQRAFIETKIGESLTPFTHLLIGIDHPESSGGTTPGDFTYLAASNFTPSFIAHELGHRFGAGDAFLDTPAGPDRYKDRYCVMGALGFPATFADTTLIDPSAPMLNRTGPNMSSPTLLATGWLDEQQHGVGVDLSQVDLSVSGGRPLELSALSGAPGPGWNRPPVMARYQDLLIEYRFPDGWDSGLADPASPNGFVVVHRSPVGAPVAVFVRDVPAQPGAAVMLGSDLPVDIFAPGPLTISIQSVDAAARTIRVRLGRRAARQPPSGRTFGGVDAGGGGLVWTPGRGFTKVPPHSPLIRVLEGIARMEAIQVLMATANERELPALAEEGRRDLAALHRNVADLRLEASSSPLAHALEQVSDLQRASDRLDPSSEPERTRAFVEASRQHLAEVQRILTDVVADQGRL
jgi:hypothetical protein